MFANPESKSILQVKSATRRVALFTPFPSFTTKDPYMIDFKLHQFEIIYDQNNTNYDNLQKGGVPGGTRVLFA